jgi:autotransporter adhesin
VPSGVNTFNLPPPVATGIASTAVSVGSRATGNFSFAAGQSSLASGDFSTAVGQSAMATGTEASAFGQGSTASGNGSLALGQAARASGDNSTAVGGGQGAVASGLNSVALGQGAQALATNSVAIGTNTIADQPNTVSLGGRCLTNVAPGIASTDGATVGQVNQASKRAYGGIATAMAMGGIAVPETKLYAVSANLGAYRGETALAGGMAFRLTDNTTLNGSIGVGVNRGDVGGRVGLTFAW